MVGRGLPGGWQSLSKGGEAGLGEGVVEDGLLWPGM